jgi:hypothetical protein
MCPQAEAVAGRIGATAHSWWWCSFLSGTFLAAAISIAVLLVFVLADMLFHLNEVGLWVLFGIWAGVSGVLALVVFVRAWRSRRTLEATARRLEMEYPELGSHLINVVQLWEEEESDTNAFCKAALTQAAVAVEDFPFEDAPVKETRRRRFALCMQTPRDLLEAAGVLIVVLVCGVAPYLLLPPWASALERVLQPWKFVPAVGTVEIVRVTPGDTDVLVGSPLTISAEINDPEGESYSAVLYVQRPGEDETEVPLLPDKKNRKFATSLAQVLSPFRYRIEVGDTQTDWYDVNVRPKPAIAAVRVTYLYPDYLRRKSETLIQKHGDLEAPQFTLVDLQVRATTPIARGYLLVDGRRIPGRVKDRRILMADLFLKESTTCTVHLFNDAGHTDPEPRVNQVRVSPDAPPCVELVEPARDSSASPGKAIAIVIRAGDDHGLARVWVELRPAPDAPAGAVQTVASWEKFASDTAVVLRHRLVLDAKRFKPGQTILVRAVARDRRNLNVENGKTKLRLQPQETATAWHQVRLIAPEARAAADRARIDQLRIALAKILREQTQARVALAQAPRQRTPSDASRLVQEVRARQVAVQKQTVALVKTLAGAREPQQATARRVLNKLAYGEMLQAVRQAEALPDVKAAAELAQPAAALGVIQDRILDVLRRLLNEERKEAAEALAQMKKRADSQLPSDVQNKLRELKKKLDEFLKQQKKVIEASENLAKKPVEDFTDKEKELLKQLAAAEDEWSRFLADKHSDFSKLPEQDFSNPSLLKEMVEIQTQLKMARDALTSKTADIAVPLEQLGAEMAKEMSTNIEKWLPDTPDRERWSQEEPITDDMKEAPMAELPRELEDLVGELMEQEEDLFDEMEDASSSWADSIDKGAGWDAADGPISNNSARGVTGNRLPNTSEIGGRSGEGRQGKSNGEMVGDEAVGKGGRKTSTRLSPDAHVKGRVKDKSKEPTGGSTGGGKESGEGGQGLHGPTPNRAQRQMQRLASKQAELRNKAEGVDLRFQVLRYHRTDLKKMVAAMAAVEQDLRAGNYRNALRRREVMLEGLGRVKKYLKGEMTIRQDRTTNLPTDIQKDLLGSMHEAAPQGWEKLNQKYFERLASTRDTGKE